MSTWIIIPEFTTQVLSVAADPPLSSTGGTTPTIDAVFTGVAPPDIASASAAGTEDEFSRRNHTHKGVRSISVAAPLTRTGTDPDFTINAPFTATAPPGIVPDGASAAGAANEFARRDHNHGLPLSNTAASAITDSTNGAGTADEIARRDHTHGHGDRGGGTLHADVTTTVDGFMIAADKLKLDTLITLTTGANSIPTGTGNSWSIPGGTPYDGVTGQDFFYTPRAITVSDLSVNISGNVGTWTDLDLAIWVNSGADGVFEVNIPSGSRGANAAGPFNIPAGAQLEFIWERNNVTVSPTNLYVTMQGWVT